MKTTINTPIERIKKADYKVLGIEMIWISGQGWIPPFNGASVADWEELQAAIEKADQEGAEWVCVRLLNEYGRMVYRDFRTTEFTEN